MDIEIPKMSVEILGSLPTYVPVFSTANASLTASFTVVTRSSWGKGSHCVRGGGGGEGGREEKRGREEGELTKRRGGSRGEKGKEKGRMISYQTQVHTCTHTLLTKAVLMASTNLSSGSSRSDWAWEGVVDHIRELSLSDSYTERRGREGGERERREGREEKGDREERGGRGEEREERDGRKSERCEESEE